jgi:voltage-gated potassium channel
MSDPNNLQTEPKKQSVREKIHEIIFEADTFWGAFFDISLLIAIVISVIITCLATVEGYTNQPWIDVASMCFTALFTVEYLLRIYCVRKAQNYIFSFWGIIDLLSVLPDYFLIFFYDHTRALSVIRSLRLLRVFRIFKLGWFQSEADDLGSAVWRARAKIIVFLAVVMIIVTVTGTLMYEIENICRPNVYTTIDGDSVKVTGNDFDSIPEGIYWAVVTMTTVGFGDTVPKSALGKFLSSVLILLGYSLIIVPTGFVSAEIIESRRKPITTRSCSQCVSEGHDLDARHCKYCGAKL